MQPPDPFKPLDVGPVEYRIRTVLRHLESMPGLNPEDFSGRELRAFVLKPDCPFDTPREAEAFGKMLAKLSGGHVGIVDDFSQPGKFLIQVTLTANPGTGIFGSSDARKLEACSRKIDSNSQRIRNLLIEFGARLPVAPPTQKER